MSLPAAAILPVMGTEGSTVFESAFTVTMPPTFDGHSNYSAYRQDVELWECLTTLAAEKRGPAIIGRLSGEAKSSAKTLSIAEITANDGVTKILVHLDKSYAVDATDQLDLDLAAFLDYSWRSTLTVEQFIAGFHVRLDKISDLNMDDKLKGHLLLRQAGLDTHTRNMIVGAASGQYDVGSISAALRQAYRGATAPPSMTTHPPAPAPIKCDDCQGVAAVAVTFSRHPRPTRR